MKALLLLFLSIISTPPILADNLTDQKQVASARATELGIKFTNAINNTSFDTIDLIFDFNAFANKTADTFLTDQAIRSSYINGLISAKPNFFPRIASNIKLSDGKVKFLKVISINNQSRPLLLLDLKESGYDFWELIIENNNITDIYQLSTGRYLTATIGAISGLMSAPNEDIISKLFNLQKPDTAIIEKFKQITEAANSKNYQSAYDTLNTLPEKIRNAKIILTMAINYAGMINEALYRDELEKLATHYGDDPATAFMLIDHYFFKKEYDKALASLQSIHQRYGDVSAIYLLQANTYYVSGDYTNAIHSAEKAIQLDADDDNPYWTLISCYLEQKDFIKIKNTLIDLQNKFGYLFTAEIFEEDPVYQEFTHSDVFMQWNDIH